MSVIRKYGQSKKLQVLLERYPVARDFLNVWEMLTKPIWTASGVRKRLGISQRELNYYEGRLFDEDEDEKVKSKWRKYSIVDLLAFRVFFNCRNEISARTAKLLFHFVRGFLTQGYNILLYFSRGGECFIVNEIHDPDKHHMFLIPDQVEEYMDKMMHASNPLVVFPLGSLMRGFLSGIATDDFSVDVSKDGVVNYKIGAKKIQLEDLPDPIYKELDRVDDLEHSGKKNG